MDANILEHYKTAMQCLFHSHVGTSTKVYLTSPGPSEIGYNSFISQPILKPLRPVDSSLDSESSDICH